MLLLSLQEMKMGKRKLPPTRSRKGEQAPPKLGLGKDELNLAEFPLCSIADRVEPGQKTLRFEDRIWDESRGELITRKLTIFDAETPQRLNTSQRY